MHNVPCLCRARAVLVPCMRLHEAHEDRRGADEAKRGEHHACEHLHGQGLSVHTQCVHTLHTACAPRARAPAVASASGPVAAIGRAAPAAARRTRAARGAARPRRPHAAQMGRGRPRALPPAAGLLPLPPAAAPRRPAARTEQRNTPCSPPAPVRSEHEKHAQYIHSACVPVRNEHGMLSGPG